MSRVNRILIITRRLIVMTGLSLLCVALLFAPSYFNGERFMLSWACFSCGILGGFVSIQQRLKKLEDEELRLLSNSWFSILLIPIYGGIFSLVLYVGFLSGIVGGSLFPQFFSPPFSSPPVNADLQKFLTQTLPVTGTDLAKLLFWSFLAGFSERLVPQILNKTQGDLETDEEELPPETEPPSN